jgi:hypothetical protein
MNEQKIITIVLMVLLLNIICNCLFYKSYTLHHSTTDKIPQTSSKYGTHFINQDRDYSFIITDSTGNLGVLPLQNISDLVKSEINQLDLKYKRVTDTANTDLSSIEGRIDALEGKMSTAPRCRTVTSAIGDIGTTKDTYKIAAAMTGKPLQCNDTEYMTSTEIKQAPGANHRTMQLKGKCCLLPNA